MELDWGFGWTEELSRLLHELTCVLSSKRLPFKVDSPSSDALSSYQLRPWLPSWPSRMPMRQELAPYKSTWMQTVFASVPQPRLRLSLLPRSGAAGAYLWIQLLPNGSQRDELYLFFTLVAAWYQAQRTWALEPWVPEALALPLCSESCYGLLLPVQMSSPGSPWIREFPSLVSWYITDFFSISPETSWPEVWLKPLSQTGFRDEVLFGEGLASGALSVSSSTLKRHSEQSILSLRLGSMVPNVGAQALGRSKVVFSSLLKLLTLPLPGGEHQGWRIPDDWSHEDLLDEFWFWQVELADSWVDREAQKDGAWRLAAYPVREPGLHYRRHHWRRPPHSEG